MVVSIVVLVSEDEMVGETRSRLMLLLVERREVLVVVVLVVVVIGMERCVNAAAPRRRLFAVNSNTEKQQCNNDLFLEGIAKSDSLPQAVRSNTIRSNKDNLQRKE